MASFPPPFCALRHLQLTQHDKRHETAPKHPHHHIKVSRCPSELDVFNLAASCPVLINPTATLHLPLYDCILCRHLVRLHRNWKSADDADRRAWNRPPPLPRPPAAPQSDVWPPATAYDYKLSTRYNCLALALLLQRLRHHFSAEFPPQAGHHRSTQPFASAAVLVIERKSFSVPSTAARTSHWPIRRSVWLVDLHILQGLSAYLPFLELDQGDHTEAFSRPVRRASSLSQSFAQPLLQARKGGIPSSTLAGYTRSLLELGIVARL
ncbi:uncharacterized protein J3D65DRAFT_367892 [Phyllosticta citribraziliensis]|uniref:Uncharacterized protein n=1 Tax=Phyllosticta citribraziliensis TaxID=989973 RepID=A0ABR1LRK6_9PEZI